MSTDAQPPSPKDLTSSPDPSNKPPTRTKRAPPVAFETKLSFQKHRRSSSFSEFVSRLLPSRRAEKGYALRSEFNDDSNSTLNAASSNANTPRSAPPDATAKDGGETKQTRSWSPLKDAPQHKKPTSLKRLFGSSKTGATEVVNTVEHQRSASQHTGSLRKHQTSPAPPTTQFERDALPPVAVELGVGQPSTTTAQQIFEGKKNRRQHRRSLRDSGDFLGVQGANPRTGYWDISDATSSSDPSQMSEETRRKLAEQAREASEQKEKYEQAQEQYQTELVRVQTLREKKRKEKAERRKMELKIRQRRQGKWKLSENSWSSVAEPELSPIVQSLVGSPVTEVAPADLLFPMPSAADPTPYEDVNIEQSGYFSHRAGGLNPSLGSTNRVYYSLVEPVSTFRPLSIQRKPIGSPVCRQLQNSSDTVIRTDNDPTQMEPHTPASSLQSQQNMTPSTTPDQLVGEQPQLSASLDTTQERGSFLGQGGLSPEPDDQLEREAIAISFQPGSTRQVLIRPRSAQSQECPKQERGFISLRELQPVCLKDPFTARVPQSSQQTRLSFPVWEPPSIIQMTPEIPRSSTNTSTTITTGPDHLPPRPAQFDGHQDSESAARARVPSLQHKPGRITLRTSSLLNTNERVGLKTESLMRPVDIVISSEHHLSQMRQRTARLCHTASPEVKIEMKSIPISTSTSQGSSVKEHQAARSAAQLAFQRLNRSLVTKTRGPQENKKSMSPQATKTKKGPTNDAAEVENGRGREESGKYGKAKAYGGRSRSGFRTASASPKHDRLIVWHSEPNIQKMSKQPKNKRPIHQSTIKVTLVDILQKAWLFVEPVFDPRSGIRKRFQQRRLTWSDIGLFFAAGCFLIALLLVAVAFARVLGMALSLLRTMGAVFQTLTGF